MLLRVDLQFAGKIKAGRGIGVEIDAMLDVLGLISAATAILFFLEVCYNCVTVADICAACDITKPSCHAKYYPKRQEA